MSFYNILQCNGTIQQYNFVSLTHLLYITDLIYCDLKSENTNRKKRDANDKKDDPKNESTTCMVIDYLQKKLMEEGVTITPELQDHIIALAVREATLNELDLTFKQPYSDIRNFSSEESLAFRLVIADKKGVNHPICNSFTAKPESANN